MFIWLCVLAFAVPGVMSAVMTQPEQVHLSYGGNVNEMVVTWVTLSACNTTVEYGLKSPSITTLGTTKPFQDGGSEKRVIYIHRATMIGLKSGHKYVYHVGSNLGWSELFTYRALREGTNWPVHLALFGDMGNANAQSLPRLQQETERDHFDAILHIGDFAYNMDSDNGRIGDAFMKQIQPLAAYVPYMTTVGNHENAYNFSHYINRFTMPGGSGNNMFFSFNLGPVHFVSFSSEYYYYVQWGWEMIAQQYAWLIKDLQEANKPANRAARPWIITMTHRPMYCSDSDDPEHCPNPENVIRVGIPLLHAYSPEQLLYKYGVDLHLQAHEHTYERTWPVYNNTVCNGSKTDPYRNPTAPIHIVTGSAGCQEVPDPFYKDPQPFSAFRSSDYGYSRMTIYNNTHLYLEQVSDDKHGQVIDKMMLIKERHEPHSCGT